MHVTISGRSKSRVHRNEELTNWVTFAATGERGWDGLERDMLSAGRWNAALQWLGPAYTVCKDRRAGFWDCTHPVMDNGEFRDSIHRTSVIHIEW